MLRRRRSIPLSTDRHPSGPRAPARSHSRRRLLAPDLEPLESRRLLTTFTVKNALDDGDNINLLDGSLRAAIVHSNQSGPGPNSIVFDIPASKSSHLNVPVTGFDPVTQTWTITSLGPLPPITTPVTIDGFTQANTGIPYRYPNEITSTTQQLSISGATAGTFTLSTSSPLPVGMTATIPYNPTPTQIQTALEAIVGQGNVSVTGVNGANQQPGDPVSIAFEGTYAGESIPNLTADASNLTGVSPTVTITTTTPGGTLSTPTYITSVPNSTAATAGNNAKVRVIIDGSASNGGIGFDLDTSYSTIRGLIITDFGVGVEVPNPSNIGNSIQGDFIGAYLTYPVDSKAGTPLPAPAGNQVVWTGNTQQGVIINGQNTTVGGASLQDDNVIAWNGSQGVWIQPGALGSQVLGCQIGVIGASDEGVWWSAGNGAEGVLVQSSSDLIGVAGAGNLIGANTGDGVQLDQGVTQVQVAGNYIGVPPGGGLLFGSPPPGNGGNGVALIGATNCTIGGALAAAGNTISANAGSGVVISGATATGNVVSNDLIGVSADGGQAMGNGGNGIVISSSGNQVGPGDVISANQIGVVISGATTTGITVIGDLIGTDLTGKLDLGNAFQGVLIDGAVGVTIQGDGAGSQVISGNNVGIELTNSAVGALIEGTFLGTDKTGTVALPNAQQGILIDGGAWKNTIGGTSSASRNVISANHWGIVINGGPPSGPSANAMTGNLIGTDITGRLPLGNEIDGIQISASSGNSIGGILAAQGNTIAFNTDAGVHIISGNADAIESNSIFSNGTLGIQLDGTSNDGIPAPTVTEALPDSALQSTEIDLTYTGAPNSTYLIQFFSTPGAVAQGRVEGETFLGATTVRTDAKGSIIGLQNGYYAVDVAVVVAAGDWVTATVTYMASISSNPAWNSGDTSEFSSPPITAINPFLVTSTVDVPASPAPGTLRYAVAFSNNHPSPSVSAPNDIQFRIAGVGLQTIVLQQALPAIIAPLIIDGYSQPGSRTNDSAQLVAPDTLDAQETDIAVIQIQVDGSGVLGTNAIGLDVQAPGCTIDGLSLTGFSGAAIFLEPGSATISGAIGTTVWGNFIGISQFNPQSYNPVKPATNAFANGVGILIDGPNNVVGGSSPGNRNVIQGNRGDGVIVYGAQGTGNTIATNFILDNGGDGVLILSASNRVGLAQGLGLAGAGNLISGNQGNGVHILDPSARGNTVVNNEIGTDVGLAGLYLAVLGMKPRPNALSGVLIEDAPANTVGGLVAGSANVLAGNVLDGITIENYVNGVIPSVVSAPPSGTPYTGGTRSVVEGNLIGYNTRYGASATIPNQEDGVNISSSGNIVGGHVAAARNTIVSNRRNGITIAGVPLDASGNPDPSGLIPFPQPVANVVEGNFIGTVSGSDDYGNAFDGILLDQAGGNTVGGTAAGAGNVIGNNGVGVAIVGSLSSGNVVAGNLIGTTSDGRAAMGNGSDGVAIVGAPGNVIGGTVAGAANVVAGNTNGIHLSGPDTTGNLVEGDFIGTSPSGTSQLGNSLDGVAIDGNASNNTVGGTAAGAGNVIAFNAGVGVHVLSGTGNTILSDSISSNDGTGIVLVGSANHGQAAPAIASATPLPAETLIAGTLASTASTTFLIQLFSGTTADIAGTFEGQALVGSITVTTDSGGQAGFSLALSGSIPVGAAITATATSLATGDTSAFSAAALNSPLIEFAAAQFYVSAPAASAVITVTRNTGVGSSTVVYAAGPGTAIPGVDFTPVTAALTFAPGQTSATFSVPIIATQGRLGQFTVDLSLSHPTAAGLGAPNTAILTIASSPGSLQFSTSTVMVPESGGGVTVTVNRVGGASGTVGVSYSTASINAVAGVDYLPVSGTLTFSPGVTQESFVLPVLGSSTNPNDATISITLSGPTGGASLGSPTTESVTIDKPLIVTGQQLSTVGRGITSVVLSFNKPLDPAQAGNLANYGFFVYWSDASGVFQGGGKTTPLAFATYNPGSLSVTLTPSAVLPFDRLYRLDVNGNARPVLVNGLVDTLGGQLEGSSGVPGTPYLMTFGAGKRLSYVDGTSNVVTLQLRRGGVMQLFQSPGGAVQQLGLVGTVPGRSTLTGSVRRGHGGNGRTKLPPISGAGGVHIKLKGRPFVVARAAMVAGEGQPFARRAWHR